MSLIDDLINNGWLRDEKIIKAFRKIKRADFMMPGMEEMAELNEALPIGFGQTISQPLVVAFMIQLLEPQEGEKILDIGSGSGWTTALLAELVGETGKVIGVEIIPQLKMFGEQNVAKYDFIQKKVVQMLCLDGSKGYEKEAPYDKILCSASAESLPEDWQKQLKIGGKIVTPIKNSIWLFTKKSENEFTKKEYPGFIFVPLVSKQ